MNREQIVNMLRAHQVQLQAQGLLHLRLFGSNARNEQTPNSDVDLLYELDPNRAMTLFDLGRLQYQLTDILGTEVDLASANCLKSSIRDRILHEAVVAF